MKSYTVLELAKLLNLTERRIQQLANQDIIPKASRGQYELAPALQGYTKYLQDLAANKGNSLEQKDFKARLLKAQAEKAELELDVLKEKYLEASEVEFTWSDMVLTFRSRMLAIPSKLVGSLAAAGGDFAKIQKILEDEIYDALTELSKSDDEEYEDKA
jgi:phage terminase Nu1 subunit (DNA packaging protein)